IETQAPAAFAAALIAEPRAAYSPEQELRHIISVDRRGEVVSPRAAYSPEQELRHLLGLLGVHLGPSPSGLFTGTGIETLREHGITVSTPGPRAAYSPEQELRRVSSGAGWGHLHGPRAAYSPEQELRQLRDG